MNVVLPADLKLGHPGGALFVAGAALFGWRFGGGKPRGAIFPIFSQTS